LFGVERIEVNVNNVNKSAETPVPEGIAGKTASQEAPGRANGHPAR